MAMLDERNYAIEAIVVAGFYSYCWLLLVISALSSAYLLWHCYVFTCAGVTIPSTHRKKTQNSYKDRHETYEMTIKPLYKTPHQLTTTIKPPPNAINGCNMGH